MASQPLTGVNQQPLVFAQIRNGSTSPEVIKARIVTSSRVVNIKSNMFLHLFYSKPYQRDQGYNHAVDQAYGFQVKSDPAKLVYREDDILAAGPNDVGDMKTEQISEREFLTMSEDKTWNFKPSVRVADFFANSLGVPIDCWTPCSRIAIARELEAADLIKYELQCGDGDRNACAMEAGELAVALHDGDQMSFDECDDLHGYVQLSILFVNENPDIQALDFRLRMRIVPCRCPPVLVAVPTADGSEYEYYRAKLAEVEESESSTGFCYVLDDEVTEEEAKCLGYNTESKGTIDKSSNLPFKTEEHIHWSYPARGSVEEVKASNFMDVKEEGVNLLNMEKSFRLSGNLLSLDELNNSLRHFKDTDNDGFFDQDDDKTRQADAFPNDPMEWADNDGDGMGDNADEDDDNDGVRDENDAFPKDSTQQTDHDEDGKGDRGDELTAEQMTDRAHKRIITLSNQVGQGLNSGDLPNSLNDQMVSTLVACEEYDATEKKWIAKMCREPLGMLKAITSYVAPEDEQQQADGEWTYEVTVPAGDEIPQGSSITDSLLQVIATVHTTLAAAQEDRTLTIKVTAATETDARAKISKALYYNNNGLTDDGVDAATVANEEKAPVTYKAEVLEQKAQILVEAQDVDQLKRLEAFQASSGAPKDVQIANDTTQFQAIDSGIPAQ